MTTTQQLLQITPDEHEKIILSNYMAWCKSYNAGKDEIMQRFLTSPNLFNWWYQEYKKLEQNFETIAKPYASFSDKEAMINVYRREMLQMHRFYCKPLIYTSKYKVQHITNHINN